MSHYRIKWVAIIYEVVDVGSVTENESGEIAHAKKIKAANVAETAPNPCTTLGSKTRKIIRKAESR